MALDLRFLPEIPDGMRIWYADEEVAGISYRIKYAREFAKGRNLEIKLVREPRNRHDGNDIRVLGIYKGWFFTRSVHIGYVTAEIAKAIVKSGSFDELQPRLKNIWWGGYVRDFIVVRFDILQPKPAREVATPKPKKRKPKQTDS